MKTDYLMYHEESGPNQGWYFHLSRDVLSREEAIPEDGIFTGVLGPCPTEWEAISERERLLEAFHEQKEAQQ